MNPIEAAYCRTFQTIFRAALPILPYREPKRLNSVEYIVPLLQKKRLAKPLVVTDKNINELGLIQPLINALLSANMDYALYDETVANPTISNVEAARHVFLQQGCDSIIAFGGGSPMDCAKATGARIAKPNQPVSKMRGILKIHKKLPLLIAIPTTAGTGSETTLAAVITDEKTHHKYPINDFSLIPHHAVLDYRTTINLPKHITSTTGIDALVHAVEAYIGRSTTKETRTNAEEAVILINRYLKRAYDNGSDIEAREAMLHASYCAGAAFTKSYVGYIHGIAHSLGGQYGVPHGLANAILAPYVLEAYGISCHKQLGKLARIAQIAPENATDAQASAMLINWFHDLNDYLNIPRTIDEIKGQDIPKMARNAAKESNPLYPVPKLLTAKQLEQIYRMAMTRPESKPITQDDAEDNIKSVMNRQRSFFATGKTIDVDYRIKALAKLQKSIQNHEIEIENALKEDLGKSHFESYMCEVGLTLSELRHQIGHVRSWSKPKPVLPDLANFHSSCWTTPEPYGITLVMAPWNYPFMLTMEPLIGAIAAGNCCVVKPSAYSPATSHIMAKIIEEVFEPGHVDVVLGGRKQNALLLDQRFDYIFFTGSVNVGKVVQEKASRHLTPISLELGGKSPCIIAADANLEIAAARVAFGKWLNLGQTCVAPDYVLVEESVEMEFIELLSQQAAKMYGANVFENPDYGRMVNKKHFDRVMSLIDPEKVVYGGRGNEDTLQIEPTIMMGCTTQDAAMQEEIFGPVLPIISVRNLTEAEAFIKGGEKPLALYLFTTDNDTQEHFMRHVSFGGGCINDTIVHLATSRMGFGGVGNSGIGSYHGKQSFETFSHRKSILKKHQWIDLPLRYQPYTSWKLGMIRMFLR